MATERFHGRKADTIKSPTHCCSIHATAHLNLPQKLLANEIIAMQTKDPLADGARGPFTCKSPSIPILRVNLGRAIMDPDSVSLASCSKRLLLTLSRVLRVLVC